MLAQIFAVVLVVMATLTQQQGTGEDIAYSKMTLSQAQEMFKETYKTLDLNHDLLVDLTEFKQPYLKHDHDNNGALTLAEFLQQAPAEENQETLTSDFRFHDLNHDDVISVTEMQNQFSFIDTDAFHGKITSSFPATAGRKVNSSQFGRHLSDLQAHNGVTATEKSVRPMRKDMIWSRIRLIQV